ncbi:MAG: ABC transporter substrate-binding protein, partial [Rhodospirillales bacterium]|nr:ABC transporter substrate-binding protein [Rhodospirillales bacterium]
GKSGHKILDVMVAGVSMVVTQRSEFRSVISKQGVTGLIETLRLQVSKFSAQKN